MNFLYDFSLYAVTSRAEGVLYVRQELNSKIYLVLSQTSCIWYFRNFTFPDFLYELCTAQLFVWMITHANRTAPFYGCLVAIFYCSPWAHQYVVLSYLDMKEFWDAFRRNRWWRGEGGTKKKSDRNPELCTQKQIKPKFSSLEVYKRRLRRISCWFHYVFSK